MGRDDFEVFPLIFLREWGDVLIKVRDQLQLLFFLTIFLLTLLNEKFHR